MPPAPHPLRPLPFRVRGRNALQPPSPTDSTSHRANPSTAIPAFLVGLLPASCRPSLLGRRRSLPVRFLGRSPGRRHHHGIAIPGRVAPCGTRTPGFSSDRRYVAAMTTNFLHPGAPWTPARRGRRRRRICARPPAAAGPVPGKARNAAQRKTVDQNVDQNEDQTAEQTWEVTKIGAKVRINMMMKLLRRTIKRKPVNQTEDRNADPNKGHSQRTATMFRLVSKKRSVLLRES